MSWISDLWARRKDPCAPAQALIHPQVDFLSATGLWMPQAAPPGLKQEQFADAHHQIAQQENRNHAIYMRTVAVNNRFVDRDEGDAVRFYDREQKEHLQDALHEPEATPEELKALGIVVASEE